MSNRNGARVVILGLDGATLDLIEPWARAGALPNIASLLERGSYGKLSSTIPFVTPLAWSSIYTGVNPGKHGMMGFHKRVAGTYRWSVTSSADLRRPTLWELLSQEGIRSTVLFAPYTYPVRPFDGTLVAGAFGPRGNDPRRTHPAALAQDLGRRFNVDALFGVRKAPGLMLGEITQRMIDGVREQTASMEFVVKHEPADVVFAVWFDTDRAAHLLWHHSDLPCPPEGSPIHRVYSAVDEGVGRVLEASGDDPLVILCSDHGTCPITTRVNAHLWLEKEGLLGLNRSPGSIAVSAARTLWRRAPDRARKAVPIRRLKQAQQDVEKRFIEQNAIVSWPATSVYPHITSAEAMSLNVKGREPGGIVDPDGCKDVLETLGSKLAHLEDSAGNPLVDRVYFNAQAYSGPFAELGPDIVAAPSFGTMFAPAVAGDRTVFSSPERPDFQRGQPVSLGYHQRYGVVCVSGPGTRRGARLEGRVEDIVPTVLRYLNLPMPRDLDAMGLHSAFHQLRDPRWTDEDQPVDDRSGLSDDDQRDVEKQLRELGYLE